MSNRKSPKDYAEEIDQKQVLKSKQMGSAARRAISVVKDKDQAMRFAHQALSRLPSISKGKSAIKDFSDDLGLLLRMVMAYYRKDYRQLPLTTLIRAMVGVVYFVFIVDFIPDFIPIVGLLDDATVIAWVVSGIRKELQQFSDWEKNKKRIAQGLPSN